MVLSIMTLTLFACTPQTDEDSTVLIPDTNDESFVDELLEQLSLEAKVGQMLQAERQNITPDEVKDYNIGSLLSGGGSHPESPSDGVDTWYDMVKGYQDSATASSSGIPLIYGVDAVHGHNNVYGATIFPHNINLDMANDADLMGRIGEITATEMKTTGVHWNFSPAVSVVKDIRWGRSYEGFSEDNSIHANLVSSYIEGLQSHDVTATAKHFVADGGTDSGVDQGDVLLSEDAIRDILLPPFEDAAEAGVDSVMISFSSINGQKMHSSKYWITDVLKNELAFEGIVISDWNATFQLEGDFYQQMVTSVNAGIDMLMLPPDWKEARAMIVAAVDNEDIEVSRIDDAVKRILTVKHDNNLFDEPDARLSPDEYFATDAHKAVAREAARKSFVLLENNGALPLNGDESLYLTGPSHDHLGYLSGGWTIRWQGYEDRYYGTGQTFFDAMSARIENETGTLEDTWEDSDTVVVIFTEPPYTEGVGDTNVPSLFQGLAHPDNQAAYNEALAAKEAEKTVIGVIASGRPLLLEDTHDTFDALVAIFLPGSEGDNALCDVLYGDENFSGKLSFAWPENEAYFTNKSESNILYSFGYGLSYED